MTASADSSDVVRRGDNRSPPSTARDEVVRTEKPWGHEDLGHVGRYAAKLLFVRRGERLSLQYHEQKDETLFVHRGRPEITIDATTRVYEEGEIVRVPAGTVHRIAAPFGDVEIFEASTPELDDIVRLEDDYGRIERRPAQLPTGDIARRRASAA